MIYIGIDPGQKGALAIIHQATGHTEKIHLYPFSEPGYIEALASVLITQEPAMCCLEHVSAMPGQGVTSMFNFGRNFGWIQAVLQVNQIPYELVRPQKWKKEFSITSDKNSSIAVCQRIFPGVSLMRTDKCRKPDDGMAEALLMAEYARRRL